MLTAIGVIIAKLGGGAILGVVGSLASNLFTYFTNKQKHQQDMDIRKLKLAEIQANKDYMIEEAKQNMKIIQTQTEGAIEIEDAKSFGKSIEEAMENLIKPSMMDRMFAIEGWIKYISIPVAVLITFLFGIADWIKHMLRPSMTIFISFMFAYVIFQAYTILRITDYTWTQDIAEKIVIIGVESVMNLTMVVWAWWFCDRRIAKRQARLDGNDVK